MPIKPNSKPAGGLGALKSSFHHLKENGVLTKGMALLLKSNQPEGFDCPGCAWPDANHHSTFEFCENGVKAVSAEATSERVLAGFFAEHSVSWLMQQDDYFLEKQGRLTEPMVYDAASDHYRPIAWDAAFAEIARHLQALKNPDQALFYTSGRTSNEAAFLYQLFVREFGTNNLPDCSNMCHEPSGVALKAAIGTGKGTVTLEDFDHAEAIFIFGQNPGTNHPRMLETLRTASRRGCKIVVFNPLKERSLERFSHPQNPLELLGGSSTPIATYYYQPLIGGDLALLTGLIKALLRDGELDQAFIDQHTLGFAELREVIEATDWAVIEAQSGLSRAQLEEAASIYNSCHATICTWGMGLTQHKHAVATIQMLTNLLLLKGNIGKPGAGACPVRGHSNVQGDRTMGIYEKPSAPFLDKLGQVFEFEPPRKNGFDVVESIAAMQKGEARVFFGVGGNFAAATPDTEATWQALRQCDLTVHVTTKLNRSHLVHGKNALILPCLGRTEVDLQASGPQGVTVEDSMSMVHLSHGMNKPASEHLLSEPAIIARLAVAALPQSKTPWLWLVEDYNRIRDAIAKVIDGFEDFNQRVHHPRGFYLGNSARERVWKNALGKAVFLTRPLVPLSQSPSVFTLMTVRSHDQYNTTVYGLDDRYRGVFGERRVCFIHKEDIAALGMQPGDWVDFRADWDDGPRIAKRFQLVEYDIPRGCLASYFPETNGLLALSSVAEGAGTPTSKAIPVRLRASV